MPTYAQLRWEAGPEGWELWGVDSELDSEFRHHAPIELLAWIYRIHLTGSWRAVVYSDDGSFAAGPEFDTLEEAQAWCTACVRMT